MTAHENEIEKYRALNSFAHTGGTVIFGGRSDVELPIAELKESFELPETIFNRSVAGLSVTNAAAVYDECVAPLAPSTVLLHLGEADQELFGADAERFVAEYRALVRRIRKNGKCEIAILSLSCADSKISAAMNASLKALAESENCSFENLDVLAAEHSTNVDAAICFVHSMGFVSPLRTKTRAHDVVRVLYGTAASTGAASNEPSEARRARRFSFSSFSTTSLL